MGALDVVRARLAELRAELDTATEQRGILLDGAAAAKRGLSADEQASFDAHGATRSAVEAQIAPLVEREAELVASQERAASEAATRGALGIGGAQVKDAPIYARGKLDTSFFRDMHLAHKRGDRDAFDRLSRNDKMVAEARSNTVGTPSLPGGVPAGNAGAFAPPAWLEQDYVALVRPVRVGANTFDRMPLPEGVSSINIPKITAGTTVGLATETSALPSSDLTLSTVSSAITTTGGRALATLQLLFQSGIDVDRIILTDLARAQGQDVGNRALNGTGTGGDLRGLLAASGIVTLAAGGSPTASTEYATIAQAASKVHKNRLEAPDTMLTTPAAWSYLVGAQDSTSRPLIAPVSPWNSPVENPNLNVAQGQVGRIQNLDVFVDPQMPSGTAAVYLRNDIKLWESEVRFESFDAPYADSAQILYRCVAFAAMIPDRYGNGIVKITGLNELS